MSKTAAAVVLVAAGAGAAWWYASQRPRATGAAQVAGSPIAVDDYLGLWFTNPYTDTGDADRTTSPVDPDGYVDEGFLENNFMPVIYKAGAVLSGVTGSRMQLSRAGLEKIKDHEAFAAVRYQDQAGIWTIGYGHKIKAGESFGSVSVDQALAILADDVTTAEDAVNASVRVPLSQAQFDALVSFVFNIGTGAFRRSTLLRKLNAGDASAANEFTRWVYVTKGGAKVVSNGLMNRRQAELALFNSGGTVFDDWSTYG